MKALFVLASFLLLQSPAQALTPAGEAERARQLVMARCMLCHGLRGDSVGPQFPRLAGQSPEYIVKQLFNFKTGVRASTVMQQMTEDLSAIEIGLLANYFAAQPTGRNTVDDLELAAVGRYIYFRGNRWSGVSPCVTCHGVYATGSSHLPRLAGQHAGYIESRTRLTPTPGVKTLLEMMHSAITPITEMEAKAVSQYLSGEE